MLPKTSRWTSESSWNCSTVAAMPDPRVTRAKATPRPMASWFGLTRRVLTPRKLPNGDPEGSIGYRAVTMTAGGPSAEVLAVQLAHSAGKGREDLVGQRGHLIEQAGELPRA